MAFPHPELGSASAVDLAARLATGELTSRRLAEMYLERIDAIDRAGPRVRAVIEVNPDALAIADELDRERAAGRARGRLHGLPVIVKDNLDTGDRMLTTAGSLALASAPAPRDADVVAGLRGAGALLLGKANLSEWANFRSTRSASGWSARGGQTRNPHVLDRTPCGSSSGSAAAVAAGLCAAAVGTETDGSVVCPSSVCGVAGLKPTVGLVSQRGIVPISASQDTAGPHGRTVADVALLLGAMTGEPRDYLNAYLATRPGVGVRSLEDLIRFNLEHAAEEMPFFQQEIFEEAEKTAGLEAAEYREAVTRARDLARTRGLDAAFASHRVDALVAPSRNPAWVVDHLNGDRGLGGASQMPAVAGYPNLTVPAGTVFDVLPVGLSFFGRPGSEALLLQLGHAFERALPAWREPGYRPSLELA